MWEGVQEGVWEGVREGVRVSGIEVDWLTGFWSVGDGSWK